MSNLVEVPFKKAYTVNVKDAVYQYIDDNLHAHPDAFKRDLNGWQELRDRVVNVRTHVDCLRDMTFRYHAQLLAVSRKLPPDIDLDISYAPVFSPSSLPVTLKNLTFERAAVLFNLAALYSQLGNLEDRSNADGIKRAMSHFSHAAGVFFFLVSHALPTFAASSPEEDVPLDLTEPFIESLRWTMLAQAEECFWQRAKLDNRGSQLISKIAITVSHKYQLAIDAIQKASSSKYLFPSSWTQHLAVKKVHFEAVGHYRMSVSALETSKWGSPLIYCRLARNLADQGYNLARRGKVAPPVVHDVQILLETAKENYNRAERDNDLIYHEIVPAAASLADIKPLKALAKDAVPSGLTFPDRVLNTADAFFNDLVPWGAQEAINIYNDRKTKLIKDKLVDAAQKLKLASNAKLRSLNLPMSLDALDQPVRIPPSLLKKAEEVRQENGPARIRESLELIERLANNDKKILDEAMDILDEEATADELARKGGLVDRPGSHIANKELVEKNERYRNILAQAAESDEAVANKYYEWEPVIEELTWDEDELEAAIPSSTGASLNVETDKARRKLRRKLELLNTIQEDCDALVLRAQQVAETDDIAKRVRQLATGFAQLAEVKPAMFEEALDEELEKYDLFIKSISENEQEQTQMLADIEHHNQLLLASRKDDESVKKREMALQSLDLGYHKYREIIRNLQEGQQFYNELAKILTQFKESCRVWARERSREIQYVASKTMAMLEIHCTLLVIWHN
ncbi:BRO1-domain-containing protein [Fistulina hepatica ATCC 64428]|nr:BRO1-domain-containing protein [Fistulina hepatica ATCC 64428]